LLELDHKIAALGTFGIARKDIAKAHRTLLAVVHQLTLARDGSDMVQRQSGRVQS